MQVWKEPNTHGGLVVCVEKVNQGLFARFNMKAYLDLFLKKL